MLLQRATFLISLALSACAISDPGEAPERWELESEFAAPLDGECWDVLVGPRGWLALDSAGEVTERRGLAPGTTGEIWRNVLAAEGVSMWIQTNPCD